MIQAEEGAKHKKPQSYVWSSAKSKSNVAMVNKTTSVMTAFAPLGSIHSHRQAHPLHPHFQTHIPLTRPNLPTTSGFQQRSLTPSLEPSSSFECERACDTSSPISIDPSSSIRNALVLLTRAEAPRHSLFPMLPRLLEVLFNLRMLFVRLSVI